VFVVVDLHGQGLVGESEAAVTAQDADGLGDDGAEQHSHQAEEPRFFPHRGHHREFNSRRGWVHVQVLVPRADLEDVLSAGEREEHFVVVVAVLGPRAAVQPVGIEHLAFLGFPPGINPAPGNDRIAGLGYLAQ
jgi:hypothetical protein